MKFIQSLLPDTPRRWGAAIVVAVLIPSAVTLATVFSYRQRLEQIEKKEWRYWAKTALESDSAVIVADAATGKVTGWNPAATAVLGWTPEEVLDSPFVFLVPSEYVLESYGSMNHYFTRATATRTSDRLMGTVLVVRGKINTKAGVRLECRISIRTVGIDRPAYVVTVDPVESIEEIEVPIEVPAVPEVPQAEPKREPLP